MEDQDSLVEEIKNMHEDEFKEQILQWIENKDISKCLQSNLRKNLFENFNKTELGKIMFVFSLFTVGFYKNNIKYMSGYLIFN